MITELSYFQSIYQQLFVDKKTLVINDTRSLIAREVLPHIPFVSGYDQRIISALYGVGLVTSTPIEADLLDWYHTRGLSVDMQFFSPAISIPEMTLTDSILSDADFCKYLKRQAYEQLVTLAYDDSTLTLADRLSIPLLNAPEIYQRANDKRLLKEYMIQKGLPVIDGVITKDKEEIASFFDRDDRFFIKESDGVSGFGFYDTKEHTKDEVLARIRGAVIVERVVEKISSPSVQFLIGDDGVSCIFGVSDQVLSGGRHYEGNVFPPAIMRDAGRYTHMLQISDVILQYIKSIGYRGFGGIDFIDTGDAIYACEVNARFTGATAAVVESLRDQHQHSWDYHLHDQLGSAWGDEYFPLSVGKQYNKYHILCRT